MLAYGVIRLSDPDHGPGLTWTSGHIALIAGALLFAAIFLGLLRLSKPTTSAARLSIQAATLLGLVGVVAVTAQGVMTSLSDSAPTTGPGWTGSSRAFRATRA